MRHWLQTELRNLKYKHVVMATTAVRDSMICCAVMTNNLEAVKLNKFDTGMRDLSCKPYDNQPADLSEHIIQPGALMWCFMHFNWSILGFARVKLW